MILSNIGGYYALIVPFLAFVMSSDKAFIKDLVKKIKQIPEYQGKSNKEVEDELKTKLSFIGLFDLYFTVKENNLRFDNVAKRIMNDIVL